MKIGYSVQGSTDRALLKGLASRWCPGVELIEGAFRGKTGLSLRREYSKIAQEFTAKSADAMVFLTDSDGNDWREVQKNERSKFPEDRLQFAIHGVADRNCECWLVQDRAWIAAELHSSAEDFNVDDPKDAFERAIGMNRDDKKEEAVVDLVARAPLHRWLQATSFEDFYSQIRALSHRLGCNIQNLRDN